MQGDFHPKSQSTQHISRCEEAVPKLTSFVWLLRILETTHTVPIVLIIVTVGQEVFVDVAQAPIVGVFTIILRSAPEVRIVADAAEIAGDDVEVP